MKISTTLTPELVPCQIFDAEGVEITQVIEADTESGICLCWTVDLAGGYLTDAETGKLETMVILAPPPLKIVCLPRKRLEQEET